MRAYHNVYDLDELTATWFSTGFHYEHFVEEEVVSYLDPNDEDVFYDYFYGYNYKDTVHRIKEFIITQISEIKFDDLINDKVECEDIILDVFLDLVYKTQYNSLIYGFIRKQETQNVTMPIPEQLKKMILTYYPFFCDFEHV